MGASLEALRSEIEEIKVKLKNITWSDPPTPKYTEIPKSRTPNSSLSVTADHAESEADPPIPVGTEDGQSDPLQDFNFSVTSLDQEMDDIESDDYLNS